MAANWPFPPAPSICRRGFDWKGQSIPKRSPSSQDYRQRGLEASLEPPDSAVMASALLLRCAAYGGGAGRRALGSPKDSGAQDGSCQPKQWGSYPNPWNP